MSDEAEVDFPIEPLADELRAFTHAARQVTPAPADAKARVRARLLPVLPGGGGGGDDGGGTTEPGPPDAPAPAAGIGQASRALQLVATFLAGTIVGAVGLYALQAPRDGKVAPLPPATATETAPPAPTAMVLPRVAHSMEPAEAASSAAVAASSTPRAARPTEPSLDAERALLDPARTAIGRQNPTAALEGVARHERAFPRGALVEEREAIAIQALTQLGRKDEARQRGERFLARYPDSVLAPAVRAALDVAGAP